MASCASGMWPTQPSPHCTQHSRYEDLTTLLACGSIVCSQQMIHTACCEPEPFSSQCLHTEQSLRISCLGREGGGCKHLQRGAASDGPQHTVGVLKQAGGGGAVTAGDHVIACCAMLWCAVVCRVRLQLEQAPHQKSHVWHGTRRSSTSWPLHRCVRKCLEHNGFVCLRQPCPDCGSLRCMSSSCRCYHCCTAILAPL
jgi:hypothetical protein